MGKPLKLIVDSYIGRAAAAPPEVAPDVLREAADTFAKLAMDPKNSKMTRQLNGMAMEFARAARRPARPPTISDFHDLLRETAAAYGETDDPMDLIARRREIHEERSADAPRVSISPESFNDDATLGRSTQLKYQPTDEERARGIAQEQTAAFWQGVKREAQALTVDAALTNPPIPIILTDASSGVANVRPFGIVEYGSDGNKTSVKFDLGMRLTVVGNYVSLLLGMDPPRFDSPTNEIIVAGASIGAFAAPSQAPVICSVFIDDLSGGGVDTDFIAIPTKAVRLMPIQSNLPLGGTAIISFFSYGGGAALWQVHYQQATNVPMQPVTLTRDASFIKVQNNSAQTSNFRLPFQLSL